MEGCKGCNLTLNCHDIELLPQRILTLSIVKLRSDMLSFSAICSPVEVDFISSASAL